MNKKSVANFVEILEPKIVNICTYLLSLVLQTSGSFRSIFRNLYMFTSL